MVVIGQEFVNGVTLGAMYALIAFGYTLIFGVLELIAFAQAGVFLVGAYAGLFVAGRFGAGTFLELPVTLGVAGLVGGALNVAVDRSAYRPLRRAARLAPLISGIGAYMFLENAVGTWISRQPQVYPSILPDGAVNLYGVHITSAQLVMVAIAVVYMIGLWALIVRTRLGLSIRAVAERPDTASLMGIDPERMIAVTFFVAGVLAATTGVLIGTYSGVATPTMGFLVGIKAFAAAVIGGIGNVPGALVGALVVGMTETFVSGFVSSGWADAIVFALLIATLMLRPYGILGTRVPSRA